MTLHFHLPAVKSAAPVLPITILSLFATVAVCANIIAPPNTLLPTQYSLISPNGQHWFGTDDLGTDLFSLMCQGTKNSLTIGIVTALLAGLTGTIAGTLAAYLGGVTDRVIMRIVDIFMTLPRLPTMIVCASFFTPSLMNIVFVLLIFSWTHPARIIRAKVLSMKQENYIRVAKSYGASFQYLLLRHFLPELYPIVILSMTSQLSRAIIAESALSLLGLGDPTSHSWGMIMNNALAFNGLLFTSFWTWWLLPPIIAITLFVISTTLLTREVEAWLSPKSIQH